MNEKTEQANLYCEDCNHEWYDDAWDSDEFDHDHEVECPKCGSKRWQWVGV